ncbi:hypothetical protein PISL3812_02589 [Talaromyces islandicus]|uniref:Aminoglycoside phosphotransferase domain-containing protein n=1 Tax=Talaromyces islandicus TaxID=28573 RepID=A0A0U1LQB8_TALIS|nr:hypothetical protein PISL3812_02589 [Talaromyces islandicus]
MAYSFYDEPISSNQYFANAPNARTRREAAEFFWKGKVLAEPRPPVDSSESVLHQIAHPYCPDDSIINRQVVLQSDNRIRKSVRFRFPILSFEKELLDILRANTSVPVPRVYNYYRSAEFEHLILEKIPGVTLQEAWPTLKVHERQKIADQVVAFLGEIRKLHSPHIKATQVLREPLRSGISDALEFNRERFRGFLDNNHISAYVTTRTDGLRSLPNVLTHCDLDWSNILITDDKNVSGIIDWECSGYFPSYWEWLSIKKFTSPVKRTDETWFQMLERRTRPSSDAQEVWQLEQLHRALEKHTQSGLAPEDRQESRATGWTEVCKILELDSSEPALAGDYAELAKHPLWLEVRSDNNTHPIDSTQEDTSSETV